MSSPVRRILRAGLAFAFLYPAIAALFDPVSWASYIPLFLRTLAGNDVLLLHSFGAIEVAIAAWLLWGHRIFWPSIAAAAILVAILIFDFKQMDVIFRDASILAIAVALAWDARIRST